MGAEILFQSRLGTAGCSQGRQPLDSGVFVLQAPDKGRQDPKMLEQRHWYTRESNSYRPRPGLQDLCIGFQGLTPLATTFRPLPGLIRAESLRLLMLRKVMSS